MTQKKNKPKTGECSICYARTKYTELFTRIYLPSETGTSLKLCQSMVAVWHRGKETLQPFAVCADCYWVVYEATHPWRHRRKDKLRKEIVRLVREIHGRGAGRYPPGAEPLERSPPREPAKPAPRLPAAMARRSPGASTWANPGTPIASLPTTWVDALFGKPN